MQIQRNNFYSILSTSEHQAQCNLYEAKTVTYFHVTEFTFLFDFIFCFKKKTIKFL